MNEATETETPWTHLDLETQVNIELDAEAAYEAMLEGGGNQANPWNGHTHPGECALWEDMWVKAQEAAEE